MNDETIISIVAIAVGGAVTSYNLFQNGDGVSVTALFTLIGTLLGYVFGKGTGSPNKD